MSVKKYQPDVDNNRTKKTIACQTRKIPYDGIMDTKNQPQPQTIELKLSDFHLASLLEPAVIQTVKTQPHPPSSLKIKPPSIFFILQPRTGDRYLS